MSSTRPVLPAIDSQALTPQNLNTSDWALALRLLLMPGLGAQSARKLWRVCGSLPAIWAQPFDTLAADMIETMYESKGVGLAATQVDVHERVVVMDVSEEYNQPLVMINPELLWKSDERIKGEEGCLSVPGVFDNVERAAHIKIQALDAQGDMQTYEADGLMAVCIQHEMDHLMGKVFVEYLSLLKRTRIRGKLVKAQREIER